MLAVGAWGCRAPEGDPSHDIEALQDPATCESCHPEHWREWQGSMHAYAGDDPVFLAMNAQAQRETNGAIGDFCIRCHAPTAVALGLTHDGLNLSELPAKHRGVGCYACHQIEAVEGTHNNPLVLAFDSVMRGSIGDALEPSVHGVARSSFVDGGSFDSAAACGSCHDIVTPAGVHIERTYAQWQGSFYSDPDPDDLSRPAFYALSCIDCHMDRETGAIADYPGVRGDRDRHSHGFVGVDVALTEFPNPSLAAAMREEQLEGIAEARKTALCASLCVDEGEAGEALITVWLHNEAAGHAWPSGATPDRRAWVELLAYDGADTSVFESGVVAEGSPVSELDDPNLWLFRDRLFDAQGEETHKFWEAASYESELLPASAQFGGAGDDLSWLSRSYLVDAEALAGASLPERVHMRVLLRPIGLEILTELVASGDLDPAVVDATSTFDVPPAELEWTAGDATPSEDYGSCVSSSLGCGSPFI